MRIVDQPEALEPRELALARGDSGHGCIRCGCTVFVYCSSLGDSARRGLFLLCPPCTVLLSSMPERAKVLAVLREHPLPRQKAFDRRPLPYVRNFDLLDIRFAFGAEMRQTVLPILFHGLPVITLEPPETVSGPVRLSVQLGDGGARPVPVMHDNEWLGVEGWRFERWPGRYRIVSANEEAFLVLAFPGTGWVVIESLRSRFGGRVLETDARCARLDGAIVRIPNVESQLIGVRLSAR